jgi:hypothetical protein
LSPTKNIPKIEIFTTILSNNWKKNIPKMIQVDIWTAQPIFFQTIELDSQPLRERPKFFRTIEIDPQEDVQLLRERLRLMIPQQYKKVDLFFCFMFC